MEAGPNAGVATAQRPFGVQHVTVPSILEVLPPDFFTTYWRRKPLVLRGVLPSIPFLVMEDELEAFERDYNSAPAAWRNGSVGHLGSTSFIANGECINENLARLCNRLRKDFQWPHGEIALARNREAQSWVTSGPHFDQVDNFITQAKGAKQWRLWPATEVEDEEKRRRVLRLPQYGERPIPAEPLDLVDVVVEPGDLLYVPLFWGHSVRALEPGIMFSINLKALLPSQVLLRGMAQQLGHLAEDSRPLRIPAEVPDWEEYLEAALADAFSAVTRRLAPTYTRNGDAHRAADVTAAGLADIASARHESLLRRKPAGEPPAPSPHAAAVADVLERTPLDLHPLAAPRPDVALAGIVDAFAAVHLHRFLALLQLGPQPWWPANQRDGWTARRAVIDAADSQRLLAAVPDPVLVELTTQFRDNLLAFNRRHAVDSMGNWIARLEELGSQTQAPGMVVFADARCTLPAETAVAERVGDALLLVDRVWPGFRDTFERVVAGVAAVRNVWQARQASRRARIAVIDARWAAEEVAPALAGELIRTASQLVERIGVLMPGGVASYRGEWRATSSELSHAAALLASASYLAEIGDVQNAERRRRLAASVLETEAEESLTPAGSSLLELLAAAAAGQPLPDAAPLCTSRVVAQLETLQPEDVREFVEGHAVEYARFRWSKLGIPGSDVSGPSAAGMDCGISPWVVA